MFIFSYNFEDWGLTLVAYKKEIEIRHMVSSEMFPGWQSPNWLIPRWIVPERTFPRLDSYPTGHFSDQAVLRFYISLNGQFPQFTTCSTRYFSKWPFSQSYVSPNKYCMIKLILISDQKGTNQCLLQAHVILLSKNLQP